jgi:hypothetical protein
MISVCYWLFFLKAPTSDGFIEILGVFVLAESGLGLEAKDAAVGSHQKRFDIAAVFGIVDLGDLLPDRTIFDFLGDAFENYGFIGFLRANHTVRIGGDIFCLARTGTGAEPKGILPPDAPNEHEMRAATGARGGDPIIVRFFETFESPGPGFEAGGVIGGFLERVGPMRAADLRLDHVGSLQGRGSRVDFNRSGRKWALSEIFVVGGRRIA